LLTLCLAYAPGAVRAQTCTEDSVIDRLTNDFYFSASAGEARTGDVVAVELSLSAETLRGLLYASQSVIAYDPNAAELLGIPILSEFADEYLWLPLFFTLGGDVGPRSRSGRRGVFFGGNLRRESGDALLAAGSVPLATFYFRILANPDETAVFDFVDDEFFSVQELAGMSRIACWENTLNLSDEDIYAHSDRHVDGVFRIVEGPPTQPDPPPLPPEARVYDEPITADGGNVVFELTGGVTRPGAREVPVELHITSNYEFTSYLAGGKFPAEHLELRRIEQHGRPGAQNADNERGEFWLLSVEGRRRIAREGERVHVATLYFDVRDSAAQVRELNVTLEPLRFIPPVRNWVNVLGSVAGVDAATQVEPLVVLPAQFLIRPATASRGDVNADRALDLSDAVAILGRLFQGQAEHACPEAADFNADGGVNISDPIAILNHLFLSSEDPAGPSEDVHCGP
jgi:hypothetical protein